MMIHQNPELGNCEYETAKLVENGDYTERLTNALGL